MQCLENSEIKRLRGGALLLSKRRRKKKKPACYQLNKPAVSAVQKDVEYGVISQMKTWTSLSRKGEHFTHQGDIKRMARQQNKMATSPLLPPAEQKTPKHEGNLP